MRRKIILSLLMILSIGYNGQTVVDSFPEGAESYKGGDKQFYKDFHNVLIDKNIKPCENKNEYYVIDILIYPDSSIKFIKDNDSLNIQKNKCTYEMTREVFKYLKGWNPLIVNNQKFVGLAKYTIFPDYLFEKYKEGYDIKDFRKPAEYQDGGLNGFRKKIANSFDMAAVNEAGYHQVLISFVVDENGIMGKPYLEQESNSSSFNEQALMVVGRIKGKWKPGMLHHIPVKYKVKLPLVMTF